jgi:hypothetical protein
MCQYHTLYQIARKKSDTMANVLRSILLNISFPRAIVGNNLALWYNLVGQLAHISLTSENDRLKWTLTASKSSLFDLCIGPLLTMVLFSITNLYGSLSCL